MDCLFCQIIAGKIPGEVVYQDDEAVVLRDIAPQAPTHLVIMPRIHIPSLAELRLEHAPLVEHLMVVAHMMAQREGIAPRGYRVVINCGREAGQTIEHLHIHLLGGRPLGPLA
ncbi:MAG: histidine triad nucleotide-binding protein [Chloroflexi bacterium]|nr:histidine triad nucleotide-binding protein [Chloroflexota bacterium]